MGVSPIAVPQGLAYVLNSAGAKSNVDFDYLLQTAVRESSLDPTAKASGSSALGLFQFLDSTWLQVMKEQGPRLGYQRYADAISVNADGDYVIRDKAVRAEVLKLREDPQVAADMAAAFTQANGAYLQGKFGRMPSPGELYIAHFLGPQGAEKFFRAGLANADQSAAALFPRQAKANPQIFYERGKARSIKDVYRALVASHLSTTPAAITPEADSRFLTQQLVSSEPSRWSVDTVPSRYGPETMSFNGMFRTVPAGTAVQPLIQAQAASPLVAIDAVAGDAQPVGENGLAPLPKPAPLTAYASPASEDARTVVEQAEATAANGAPRGRVLMTPRDGG